MASSPQPALRHAQDRPGPREIAALLVLSATVGLNTVDRNMLGLLLPMIQADIPMSDTMLGLLMGPAFVVVYSLAGVPLAWLADRTGRRKIIAIGLTFWSMVTAATGLAMSVVQLIVARIALGIGEASNLAPASALIGDMFSGRHRVLAMAVFTAGGPLAIMAFYPLIGWLAEERGWRIAYPFMGIVGLVVAGLTLLLVREAQTIPESTSPESTIPEADPPSLAPLSFRKAASTVLRSRAFVLLIAGGTMVSINYSALLAWLPTFMLRVHGLDAAETGALLGLYKGFFGVAASVAAGVMVTWLMHFDRRWLVWAPMALCALMAPAQLLLLLADTPLWWHVGLAAETVLLAAVNPCLFALIITLLDPRMRATGTAIYLLIFNLVGQSIGPLVVGALNDGPLAGLGDQAVRYSLLTAPVVVGLGALLLFGLSLCMTRQDEKEEPA